MSTLWLPSCCVSADCLVAYEVRDRSRLRCHRLTFTFRPMHIYANVRLTQKGRLRLIFQHLNDHLHLAQKAAEVVISCVVHTGAFPAIAEIVRP